LCINFTNEKLQATFNQAVFHAAMEENAEEDVNVEVADMTEIDNQEVIELIEGKPGGILSILNEECVVPKGSDSSFAEKLFAQCSANKRLKKPLKKKDAFQISHFAGQVTYTATGILEKNKDPVSEDLMVILKGSDEPAVRQLFTDSPDEAQLMLDRKKGAKFQGVVAKFQQQLAELLAIVESSVTHFVRCIKPNLIKAPDVWEDEIVSKQLRCSGVMEAVRVIAAGYPDRVPHSEILGRFAALIDADERPSADKEGEKVAASRTLEKLKLEPKEFSTWPVEWKPGAGGSGFAHQCRTLLTLLHSCELCASAG
jgi:myosin V